MSLLSRVRLLVTATRTLTTKTKYSVHLDADTALALQSESCKHRKHPGIDRAAGGSVGLDAATVAAIGKSLGDHPPKQVWNDSQTLTRYLRARHAPAEPGDLEQKRAEYTQEARDADPARFATTADMDREQAAIVQKRLEQRVQTLIAQRTYSWRPLDYDAYRALQYLLGRAPAEYATLVRIFGELARRRPLFAPRSFFDFGSGVGTGTWAAAQQWRESIFEYYLVDASRDMNDLAELLLRGGDENRAMHLRNVHYRQFLPASTDLKYDLVLSAFSLLELPDTRTRLETLRTLWQKCDRYLVIVEQGTRTGFQLVNEARDYLLYSGGGECSVFAPCPHDLACPRQADAADRTPCNFLAAYTQLPYAGGGAAAQATIRYEPYSYVVLEKRTGGADGAAAKSAAEAEESAWPRLVRPTLVRARHTICRMCTANGRLEEVILTKRQHGKDAYRCARVSRWGDRLPMRLDAVTTTEEETKAKTRTRRDQRQERTEEQTRSNVD